MTRSVWKSARTNRTEPTGIARFGSPAGRPATGERRAGGGGGGGGGDGDQTTTVTEYTSHSYSYYFEKRRERHSDTIRLAEWGCSTKSTHHTTFLRLPCL